MNWKCVGNFTRLGLGFTCALALLPSISWASDPADVQTILKQMHDVNERTLLNGQQSNLNVQKNNVDTQIRSEQDKDQLTRDSELPQLQLELSRIQSQKRALSAQQRQLDVKIPRPAPLKAPPPANPDQ